MPVPLAGRFNEQRKVLGTGDGFAAVRKFLEFGDRQAVFAQTRLVIGLVEGNSIRARRVGRIRDAQHL